MILQRLTTKSPPKESIGRTDRFLASASSDISKEMIELPFLECFQIMMLLRYSFVTTSSVFCFPFLFFQSAVQNRGACYTRVHIIHGKYG